ncbi:hypothetical protein F5Y14DRAFT_85559 [Nemania sp. NC0429]|nr:hypothetical protein F5Y14DRAFT_85559 [Nemania sp. NC0429]
MVLVTAPSHSQYPPPPGTWLPPSEAEVKAISSDGQSVESSDVRRAPLTITECLREMCQIPGDIFFVAAEDNGKAICFSTPVGSKQLDCTQFFDQGAFVKEVARVKTGISSTLERRSSHRLDHANLSVLGDDQSFNSSRSDGTPSSTSKRSRARARDQCQYTNPYIDDENSRPGKRVRTHSSQRGPQGQGRMSMASNMSRKAIKVGDSEAIYAFYDYTFRRCQQLACKLIGKAWIKAILPKKQASNPYTEGDKTRPDWWPETYCNIGDRKPIYLRHKEPDHLIMGERIYLLCHILRMLIEPEESQNQAIRVSGLNLDRLEEITLECLTALSGKEESPKNKHRKSLLRSMFKVARLEARFRNCEMDGETEIFVTVASNGKAPRGGRTLDADADADDDDDDDDDDEDYDDNYDEYNRKYTPASSGPPSVEPHGLPLMPQAQTYGQGGPAHYSGNSFTGNDLVHASHASHQRYNSEFHERSGYIEAPSVGSHAPSYSHGLPELCPTPQAENSKRSSVFNSPSDYGSPATSVVYSHWQNPPSHPSQYSFQPQLPSTQVFNGQMTRAPSYATSTVDGLPPPTTDLHHSDLFASGIVGPSVVSHPPPYHHQSFTMEGAPSAEAVPRTEAEHTHLVPH